MPRRTGRPTSDDDVVQPVLDAALDVLVEGGYDAVVMEEVARRAGVHKTTIYRRYPTRSALILAALAGSREPEPAPAVTGDLEADLAALVSAKASRISTPRGRAVARALTSIESDDPLAVELRKRRFGVSSALIRAGIARGELPDTVDPEEASELLLAPVVNRVVVLNEIADPAFVARVVAHTLRGLGYRKTQR